MAFFVFKTDAVNCRRGIPDKSGFKATCPALCGHLKQPILIKNSVSVVRFLNIYRRGFKGIKEVY